MNAITPITEILDATRESTVVSDALHTKPSRLRRIPVFRGGKPAGFVEAHAPENATEVYSRLAEGFFAPTDDGIVHLWGEVDRVHDVLALRRKAAQSPWVRAIIDDLWIACE